MENPFAIKYNEDGTISKLPLGAQISNVMLYGAQWWNNPFCLSATVQWLFNTARARKKQSLAFPAKKIVIFNFLVGHSCADVSTKLREFGISSQVLSLLLDLWPDKRGIGIRKSFLVPASQAGMADDIIRQHFATSVMVESAPCGTGGKFTKPWGVWAKPRSWDEAVTVALYGFLEKTATKAVEVSYDAGKDKQPAKSPTEEKPIKNRSTTGKGTAKRRKRKPKQATAKKALGMARKVFGDLSDTL